MLIESEDLKNKSQSLKLGYKSGYNKACDNLTTQEREYRSGYLSGYNSATYGHTPKINVIII